MRILLCMWWAWRRQEGGAWGGGAEAFRSGDGAGGQQWEPCTDLVGHPFLTPSPHPVTQVSILVGGTSTVSMQ